MSTKISLRPYQEEFINRIREQFKQKHKSVVGVMPCGSGKTITTGWMAKETAENGKRVLFMVHRHELIEQTSDTFHKLGIEHGIIAAGSPKEYDYPVQVASVQTLKRRLKEVPPPDLLICDECHHILADSYMKIVEEWEPFLLGVTATPERLGGITLHDAFETMVIGPSVKQLISMGNLTPFEIYSAPFKVDFKKMRTDNFGDFRADDMSNLLDRQNIIGDVVKNYQLYANNTQAIVYCINVRHSKHVAEAFRESGIRAAHVDGDTPKVERNEIIENFRNKNIQVLCNAELFGEGFDVPNMECVILARPTQSLTLYIQQSMRVMRPDPDNPDKKAIIIDHVENIKRFKAPDEDREWTLDPNKEKGVGESPEKTCPECGRLISLATRTCHEVVASSSNIRKIEYNSTSLEILYDFDPDDYSDSDKTGDDYDEGCDSYSKYDDEEDYDVYFNDGQDWLRAEGSLELYTSRTTERLQYRGVNGLSWTPDKPEKGKIKITTVANITKKTNWKLHKKILIIKCVVPSFSIKKVQFKNGDGDLFDSYVLCQGNKTWKTFIDKNENLICGHIFPPPKDTEIKDEAIIVKVYESGKRELTEEEQMAKILERPESIEALLIVANRKNYKKGWAVTQAVKHAESYQDFLHIAEVCGYKKGWAYHQWKDREKNKQEQIELDAFMTAWNNRQSKNDYAS